MYLAQVRTAIFNYIDAIAALFPLWWHLLDKEHILCLCGLSQSISKYPSIKDQILPTPPYNI
ncbi:MAG: hypothetical protein ACHBN1_18335 [Heteroscytonema crispum UTEX LB 1556]